MTSAVSARDVRDYGYVTREIAQGSAPAPDVHYPPAHAIGSRFHLVVLCAQEYQRDAITPGDFGTARVLYVPLNDDGSPPTGGEVRRAVRAAREVADEVRAGRRVLVTCRAGRNRSGLVTGLALVEAGWRAKDAVARIQRVRQNGLSNDYFVHLIDLHEKHIRPKAG